MTSPRLPLGRFPATQLRAMLRSMRVCVFCGSSPGRTEAYVAGARAFGQVLADAGVGLVYGGASVGLMGAVADAVLSRGGEVIGVIPEALVAREVAHDGLRDLRIVGSMHERKALMAELSDAFVALPGGIGTLEELFEVWTWAQLGIHKKPCGLLNIAGFYDGLSSFLEHVVAEQFLKPAHGSMLLVERDAVALLERIRAYQPIDVTKWMGRSES